MGDSWRCDGEDEGLSWVSDEVMAKRAEMLYV